MSVEAPTKIVQAQAFSAGELGKAKAFEHILEQINAYEPSVRRGSVHLVGKYEAAMVVVNPRTVIALENTAFHQWEEYAEHNPELRILFDAALEKSRDKAHHEEIPDEKMHTIFDAKF